MPSANRIVVVGAGLVGSLLAVFLRRRGYEVDVYEKRADPRTPAGGGGGRSINLVVTSRGFRALEAVGLDDEVRAITVPVLGRMIHDLDGAQAFQPYGRDDSECNYSVSRAGLNALLVEAAERRGARFRFGQGILSADPSRGRYTFGDERETIGVDAEVVFGADGAASGVRRTLVERCGFEDSMELSEFGYKELVIPALDGGRYPIAGDALHVWPRGEVMLMALANLDGSFTVTLYLPVDGPNGAETYDTPERVRGMFERHFPDALPWIPDLEDDYLANPVGVLGTVRCRPWHFEGRVALIGDAAHAIVPFFGQGMNAGFEDCRVLDELFERDETGDWETVFARYDESRKPNGDAIADMALDNFIEMRDRIADPRFLLRKAVEHRLEGAFPGEYRSRYSMVMYSHIPYRLAQEAGRVQDRMLEELCAPLGDASELDLDAARTMVRERFTPFVREREISLDY